MLYVNSCLITTLFHRRNPEHCSTFVSYGCLFFSQHIEEDSHPLIIKYRHVGPENDGVPRCQGVVFNTKAEVDYTYVQVLFEDDYDIHIYIYIYIYI